MCKKLLPLLAFFISFSSMCPAQTIYTVNNNPLAPANYHSLQNAVDSVPPGSIILLQPSPLTYGYVDVRKPIVIYGAGYFLGQNPAPNTQAQFSQSIITHLALYNGSQGSVISGISFLLNTLLDFNINQRILFDTTSNITISRCYFDYVPYSGTNNRIFLCYYSSNILIKQSYINLQGIFLVPIVSSGIVFRNNIIVGSGSISMTGYSQAPFDYSFYNNSFSVPMQYVDFTGGSFFDNVIIQNNPNWTVTVTGNMTVADHNVCNENIFPGGGTNITNADPSNTYVGFSNPAIVSQDGMYQLKPGSPAIGFASGGGDCGAYGSNSYILSGIPAIPNIYFANTQQSATTTGGLHVHLKIKAND